MGKKLAGLERNAVDTLVSYDWPGNVRELENTVERAIALAEGPRLTREDLAGGVATSVPGDLPANLEDHLESIERTCILRALAATDWNLTRAAELLGINFRSIRYRIKKLGLDRDAPPGKRSSGKKG
jgi:two-component system response regulator PilR (NtrC family)